MVSSLEIISYGVIKPVEPVVMKLLLIVVGEVCLSLKVVVLYIVRDRLNIVVRHTPAMILSVTKVLVPALVKSVVGDVELLALTVAEVEGVVGVVVAPLHGEDPSIAHHATWGSLHSCKILISASPSLGLNCKKCDKCDDVLTWRGETDKQTDSWYEYYHGGVLTGKEARPADIDIEIVVTSLSGSMREFLSWRP